MEVVMIAAARTPVGIFGGTLSGMAEQTLGAAAMLGALTQSGAEAAQIHEVIVGTAKQTSLPSNCARYTMLQAKLPEEIPAYTVQRQSASGLQAVANAVWSIRSGCAEMILAGGTESMSQIPIEIQDARYRFDENTKIFFDPIKAQLAGAQPESIYGSLDMVQINQSIAKAYQISDAAVAEYLQRDMEKSKRREARAYILPQQIKRKKETISVTTDECYPEASVTARPADAAAMCLLCSGEEAEKRSYKPIARILSIADCAGSPIGEGYVAVAAAELALKKAGCTIDDMRLIAMGELCAAQCVATERELCALARENISEKINPKGGALAVGMTWGAEGAVLLVDLVHELQELGGGCGMVLVPAEGGQSMAMVIRVDG